MTVVISVPSSLDDQTFEQVLEQLAPLPADAKILIDARYTTWASPYGLTALLTLAQTREEKPLFQGPEKDDTASYWSRANFFNYAEELFEMHGKVPRPRAGDSGTLLEITPVSRSEWTRRRSGGSRSGMSRGNGRSILATAWTVRVG